MVHARENSSVLAAVEKRLLIRIARKLPPVINSDHLTALATSLHVRSGPVLCPHPALWLVLRPRSSGLLVISCGSR